MAATHKVIVSDTAGQLLLRHMRFLAGQSADAARQATEALLRAIQSLDTMPERYPFISDKFLPPNKYRKMFVVKHYLLLYQIREDTVFVEYVIDCRQGYHWLLP